MRFIRSLIFIGLLLALITASEQQGKYIRKSISTLDYIYVGSSGIDIKDEKDKAYHIKDMAKEFDYKSYKNFSNFYIDGMPRFDYNKLPKKWVKGFKKEIESKSHLLYFADSKLFGLFFWWIRPLIFEKAIKKRIAPKIMKILNDPEVIKARATAIKTGSSLESFAATKAKLTADVTEEEMSILMNSAYICVPYISRAMNYERRNIFKINKVKATITGGIYFWKIITDNNGKVDVERVYKAHTRGVSLKRSGATKHQKAHRDALHAFSKNINMKMRMFDDFKLTGQVVSVDGKKYAFPLGKKEGVHLDDYFDLVEPYETKKGRIKNKRVGYIRVSNRANNVKNKNRHSYGTQLFGRAYSPGVLVVEYPLLGVDYRSSYGIRYGMSIKPEDAYVFSSKLFLDPNSTNILEDNSSMETIAEEWNSMEENKDDKIVQFLEPDNPIKSMRFFNVHFAYNLAPLMGKSQLFLTSGVEIGMSEFNASQDVSDLSGFATSVFLGIKRGRGGRLSYVIENAISLNRFMVSGVVNENDKDFRIRILSNFGYRLGIDLGYMLTRRLHLYAGASYNLIIPALTHGKTFLKYGEEYLGDSGPTPRNPLICEESDEECVPYQGWNPSSEPYWKSNYYKFGYHSWYSGGLNLSITLSWSIRYSKYNIWALFDKNKKY